MRKTFSELFGYKPIIGMIHLAGEHPVKQALSELDIYEQEGITAAIVENYYGSPMEVRKTLEAASKNPRKIILGVNILMNEFRDAFALADTSRAPFIQLDNIAGKYDKGELLASAYLACRSVVPDILVLGGVHPKYYKPLPGSKLEEDLLCGKERCDAIVCTGAGTGKETPLDKIQQFRSILGDFPLIVGAGITPQNAYAQLCIADGAIVGTSIKKDGITQNPVDPARICDLMAAVKHARAYRG